MKADKRIILFGNSVILGSIGASLRLCPQFEVVSLFPPLRKEKEIDSLKPYALLFDLETTHIESVISLVKTITDLLLIGISPGDSLVQVWSSRQLHDVSMRHLLEVIKLGEIGGRDSAGEFTDIRKMDSLFAS